MRTSVPDASRYPPKLTLVPAMSKRNEEIVRRHLEQRKTLTEVAAEFGVTPERVRQIVRRSGVSVEESAEVRALIRRERTYVTHVCQQCKRTFERPRWIASTYCSRRCKGKAEQIWTRDLLIAHLHYLREQLGRNPKLTDVMECEEGPAHTVYYQRFRSFRAAMEEAGMASPAPLPHPHGR